MKIIVIIILLAHISCTGEKNGTNSINDIGQTSSKFEIHSISSYESAQEVKYQHEDEEINNSEKRETRVRFNNFTLVIHDFKGYSTGIDEITGKRIYYGHGEFADGVHLDDGYLNDNEMEDDGYIETIIALKDTIHFRESLVEGGNDNKINKTLFQIIPKIENENYKLSFCCLTSLYEMFQDRRSYSETELEEMYKTRFFKNEKTDFVSISDSLKFYFPLTLVSDHNEQAWYTNGTMTKSFYDKDFDRIKNKYSLSDTLIEFSGEGGGSYATLTKDKKIFGYDTYAYLLKIDRLKDKKIIETKYIVIYIASGC